MVGDSYESLVPMQSLLDIYTSKMDLIVKHKCFQRLIEIVKVMEYKQFSPTTYPEEIQKYMDMYKNEFCNYDHVFVTKWYDQCYYVTTLVNGYTISYRGDLDTVKKICTTTWPDRKIVIIPEKNYTVKPLPTLDDLDFGITTIGGVNSPLTPYPG
jgi:hypothetical protein